MLKGKFTESELEYLRSLDAVERAEPLRITYSKTFKSEFMKRYHAGEKPRSIFESAGLHVDLIGYKRIERACAHWREAEAKDALCLTDDKIPTRDDIRAKERRRAAERMAALRSSRDAKVAELEEKLAKEKAKASTREQKIIEAQAAEIAALKAQVKALKALGTLARRTQRAPQTTEKSERFELISQLKNDDPGFNIKAACEALEVSRSGYYDWLNAADAREAREARDKEDFEKIHKAFKSHNAKKGSRLIVDNLRREQGVLMNRKKVSRLMKKFDLRYRTKKKKPYHPIGTDGLPKVAPNAVNRDFRRGAPLKVISTDITYLPSKEGFSYLSGIIDCETNEILAHVTSESLEEQFVLDTYDQLKELNLPDDIWSCSDQGVHYTARAFRDKLRELGINQSMSRKACCWDNAPIESFWSRLKGQIGETKNKTHEEIVEMVKEYVHYYNYCRGQERLGWMTPKEYAAKLAS